MKITMYELLGMVKDGKELPKKVRVLDVIYEFDDHYGDYFNKELNRYLFVYMTSEEEWKLSYFLNIQVEIIEEEKKIPEKLNFNHKEFEDDVVKLEYKNQTLNIGNVLLKMSDRIDRIIDCLDYFKSKGE